MWSFTAEDVSLVKTKLSQRRTSIEADLKHLDEEMAELERLERTAETFRTKYGLDAASEVSHAGATDNAEVTSGASVVSIPATSAQKTPETPNWGGHTGLRPAAEVVLEAKGSSWRLMR
jgi:hypothetical protein